MTPIRTSRTTRSIAATVSLCLAATGFMAPAQAALVATEQVAASQGVVAESAAHDKLLATLQRADVAAALSQRGISLEAARERVAALTDAEAAHVAAQIDRAPAGAGDILSTIVFIFVLLLVTDILGFTKVYPFTRSIR
jgi:hypothetical protein